MTGLPFPVEAGHIMMFARAIGDENPAYQGESAIAPPTFTMASAHYDPNYHLRPGPDEEWFGSGGGPGGMAAGGGGRQGERGVHADAHCGSHGPGRPGEPLSPHPVPGRDWEKEARTGRLLFSERV